MNDAYRFQASEPKPRHRHIILSLHFALMLMEYLNKPFLPHIKRKVADFGEQVCKPFFAEGAESETESGFGLCIPVSEP